MSKPAILVLGGKGQLGQELSSLAGAAGFPVSAVGHAEVDVSDSRAVSQAIFTIRPRVLINAAAYNQVDRAETEPSAAERANVVGASVAATSAMQVGIPIIHISTDYVFDGSMAEPYRETHGIAPLSVYGRTKAQGEAAVRSIHRQHLILRTAWLYGAYGSNFLKTVLRLAMERDRLEFVAHQRGSPTSTAQLAEAILVAVAAIERGAPPWGTYHVAGAGSASRFEMAAAIVADQTPFTGRSPEVVAIADSQYQGGAARRPASSVLDSSKFAAAFGYAPGHWREAVERTVAEVFSEQAGD